MPAKPSARRFSRGKPPDYVGVGAQRCGTTWWHELLTSHPRVQRSAEKELHFFDEFSRRPFGEADIERYHARFASAPGTIVGEWTPRYAHDFWTPALLRRAAPDTRLLFMVRDPVERYRSGLALQALLGPELSPSMTAHFSTDAAHRGRYAQQLRHLSTFFPRERILVLQYERCREDPVGELQRTCRFLGIDDHPGDVDVRAPRGLPGGAAEPPLPDDVRHALVASLRDDVRDLTEIAPEIDMSLWPNWS